MFSCLFIALLYLLLVLFFNTCLMFCTISTNMHNTHKSLYHKTLFKWKYVTWKVELWVQIKSNFLCRKHTFYFYFVCVCDLVKWNLTASRWKNEVKCTEKVHWIIFIRLHNQTAGAWARSGPFYKFIWPTRNVLNVLEIACQSVTEHLYHFSFSFKQLAKVVQTSQGSWQTLQPRKKLECSRKNIEIRLLVTLQPRNDDRCPTCTSEHKSLLKCLFSFFMLSYFVSKWNDSCTFGLLLKDF